MIFLFILFFYASMLVYFRIATHYNIVDKPNERSSHSEVTIRGGGTIYLVAALSAICVYPEYWVPVSALFIIGVISFVDDRITLSSRIRILVHLTAVTLLFYGLQLFVILPWWSVMALYILVIGIINAYNFMDGINGITGAYTLIVLAGLQYVNVRDVQFVNPDLIWLPIMATIVFLYFNFRKKAKCFAGDVGSISVAFWIIWLMMMLMIKSGNFNYILFLAVYGVDAVLTIMHRLILKQNIFEAHRLHFYQLMANEQKIPHLLVSSLYAALQAMIILLVISTKFEFSVLFGIIVAPLLIFYMVLKPRMMNKKRA